MNLFNTTQYVEIKTEFLKDCISLNKQLFQAVDDLDLLNALIDKRGRLIYDLDTLNVAVDDHTKNQCTQEEKDLMDRLVTMLLDQDQNLMCLLNEKRTELLKSIKNTVQNKNILKYAAGDVSVSGSYMNLSK